MMSLISFPWLSIWTYEVLENHCTSMLCLLENLLLVLVPFLIIIKSVVEKLYCILNTWSHSCWPLPNMSKLEVKLRRFTSRMCTGTSSLWSWFVSNYHQARSWEDSRLTMHLRLSSCWSYSIIFSSISSQKLRRLKANFASKAILMLILLFSHQYQLRSWID